jgi:hypothetical protein
MSLDIYRSSDRKSCLVSLSNADCLLLADAFAFLEKKTGVAIDPYGSAKLYPDHARLLLNALSSGRKKNLTNFISVLRESIDNDEILFFEGD